MSPTPASQELPLCAGGAGGAAPLEVVTAPQYYDPLAAGPAATAGRRLSSRTKWLFSGIALGLVGTLAVLSPPTGSSLTLSLPSLPRTILPGPLALFGGPSAAPPLPDRSAVLAPEHRGARVPSGPPRREGGPQSGSHGSPLQSTEEPNFAFLLGHVLDHLMRDYPRMFFEEPTMDVYHPEIEVWDDGARLMKGLAHYRMVFQIMRTVPLAMGWRPEVTARYTVDTGMREIKVRWHVKLNPMNPTPLMVDGISAYKVGRDGLVYEHRLQFVTTSFLRRIKVTPVYSFFVNMDARLCPGNFGAESLRHWASDLLKKFSPLVSPSRETPIRAQTNIGLLPAPEKKMRVVDDHGESLAVGHFTVQYNGGNEDGPGGLWQMLTDNIPPKFCVNKFDCEYKRGARCCDFLFVWSCCYPNEEDWPPSGGIGIPIADPIPIEVPERDPWRQPQQQPPYPTRRLLSAATEEPRPAEEPAAGDVPQTLVSQYHPSPLTELAVYLQQCPL